MFPSIPRDDYLGGRGEKRVIRIRGREWQRKVTSFLRDEGLQMREYDLHGGAITEGRVADVSRCLNTICFICDQNIILFVLESPQLLYNLCL